MTYTLDFSLSLGSSQTSLVDLRAQLFNSSGANVGPEVSTGFSEIGGGNYLWHYTAIPDSHRGGVKFYRSSGSVMAIAPINPQEVEYPDMLTSGVSASVVSAISTNHLNVTVVSPVQSVTNLVTLVRGDDYFSADNRALEWTDNLGVWPDLTSGSVSFSAKKTTRDSTLSVNGTVVTPTGTSKKVRAEPTAAQTLPLLIGDYNYDVQITLTNGHIVTLVADSPMKVLEDYSS